MMTASITRVCSACGAAMKPALMKCFECGTRVAPSAITGSAVADAAPQAARIEPRDIGGPTIDRRQTRPGYPGQLMSSGPRVIGAPTPTVAVTTDAPSPADIDIDFISVACECGAQFRVKPEWAGRRRKCTRCSKPILVPQSTTDSFKSVEVAQLQRLIETAIRQLPTTPEVLLKNTLSALKLRTLKVQLTETNPLDQAQAQQRRAAVLEIGGSHDRRAFDLIAPIETDGWEHLRAGLARALGMLEDPRGLPIVLRLLSDKSAEVVRESVKSLRLLRSPVTVLPLLRLGLVDPAVKLYAFDAIANIGVEAVPILLDVVQHRDPGMLLDAVILLGRIGDASAVMTLLTTVEHTTGATQAYAIESLGRIGDKRAVPKLIELLSDPDPVISHNALIALGKLPDSRAVRAILPLLESAEPDVRRHAVEALGEIGDQRSVPGLVKLLSHADEFQQDTLVEALVKIGDVNASAALLPLLSSGRVTLQLKVLLWVKKAKPAAAIDILLSLLDHSQTSVRRHEVDALGEIGASPTLSVICEVLSSDSSFEVRAAAAKALGKVGQRRAIPALEKALRDEFAVRCAAVIALGGIGDPGVAAALLSMLRDVTPEVRYHAVTALGKLGAKQAAPAIQALLDDPDLLVRQGAEKTLQTLGIEKPKTSLTLQLSRVISRLIPNHVAAILPGRTLAVGLMACVLLVGVGFALVGLQSANAVPASALMGSIQSMVATSEPNQVAVARSTGDLELWDVSSAKKLKAIRTEARGSLVTIGASHAVCLLKQTQFFRWDVANSDKLSSEPILSLPQPIGSLIVSADGRIGLGRIGKTFQSWDLSTAKKLADLELDPICKPAISGDGGTVFGMQLQTKKLVVLNATTGDVKQVIERDDIVTRTVALDQTGEVGLVSCPTKLLKINFATAAISEVAVSGGLAGLTFSTPTLALGWQGNSVLVINVATLKVERHNIPDEDSSDDGLSIDALAVLSGSQLVVVQGNSKKHFWLLDLDAGTFKTVK